jgi:hypothetical protein
MQGKRSINHILPCAPDISVSQLTLPCGMFAYSPNRQVLMTPRTMDSPTPPAFLLDFRTSAYQAIDD